MSGSKPDISKTLLVYFAPEQWGEVERFSRFYHTTHIFERHIQKRLPGIHSHFYKARLLLELARRLEPSIEEDERQLNAEGYTPARRSREVAAVVETIVCELYSVLDCFRYVFQGLYRNHKGVRDSTRGTFQRGHQGELDERIPQAVRNAIQHTRTWFGELRTLRDEITHADVGSCHRDRDSKKLIYMHAGLRRDGRALIIEDVFQKIEEFAEKINSFLEETFRVLNAHLEDTPTEQICGIFGGRLYCRVVKPSQARSFGGGVCKSKEWFEKEENPTCPLRERCGAYGRTSDDQDSDRSSVGEEVQ